MKKRFLIIYYFLGFIIFLVVGLIGQSIVNNDVRSDFNQKLALASDVALASLNYDAVAELALLAIQDISAD